jgi:hypothetical protein
MIKSKITSDTSKASGFGDKNLPIQIRNEEFADEGPAKWKEVAENRSVYWSKSVEFVFDIPPCFLPGFCFYPDVGLRARCG